MKLSPIVLLLTCLRCWEHQDIELLPPEIPHYTLSGFTVDLDDTTLVLPQTPLSLTTVTMIYDVTFEPVSIQSDSSGFFQIDSVFPGEYILTADRSGYTVVKEDLVIEHMDKMATIRVPEPLLNDFFLYNSSESKFVWTTDGLWALSKTRSLRTRDGIIPIIRHYWIEYSAGIPKLKTTTYDYVRAPFSSPSSFEAIGRVFYWHANDLIVVCLLDAQTIFDAAIADSSRIEYPLYDLMWDGNGFWSTFGSSLQSRGTDLRSVEESWRLDTGTLGPIACGRGFFWSYDKDNDLLLRIDNQDKSVYRYRAMDIDSGEWIIIHDMDFGPDEHLWVSDQKKRKFFIFDTALRHDST